MLIITGRAASRGLGRDEETSLRTSRSAEDLRASRRANPLSRPEGDIESSLFPLSPFLFSHASLVLFFSSK
jgi:hypothetical protein